MKLPNNLYLLRVNGSGSGSGDGSGSGSGDGYGSGNGYGYGYGYGYGDGSGDGSGYGNGSGSGNGNGSGDGDGSGYGSGSGNGNGSGSGYGHGSGIYMMKLWGEWFEVSGKIENSLCTNLPQHLYDKVDRNFLYKVDNLECLRALREKIGLERYISLFDAKVINEELDNQGNPMKLYRYDEMGTPVLLLEVVCPSTGRMYHLYPPNQRSKTCFEAKASTFGKTEDMFKTKFSES